MAVKTGTNIASLQAQRYLRDVTAKQASTFERLSSGQRINKSSDDAASLAIAMTLHVESKVFAQSLKNINDGISTLSVAETTLNGLMDISIRKKELAEQSSSSTLTTKQREALQKEGDALTAEYDRLVESAKFNGLSLLQPGGQQIVIQSGTTAANALTLSLGQAISGESTISTPGTPQTFTATAGGGVGEHTTISLNNPAYNGSEYEQFEISYIDMQTITAGSTFIVYDQYGTPYEYEFVPSEGSPTTGAYSIYYDENWVTGQQWDSIGYVIYDALSNSGVLTELSYDGVVGSRALIGATVWQDIQDIEGSGVSVGVHQEYGIGSYNPNPGTIQFQSATGQNYYVWFVTHQDNGEGGEFVFGTNPGLPGTGIQIDLYDYAHTSGASLAAAISGTINGLYPGSFSTTAVGNTLTITNVGLGNVTNTTVSASLGTIYAAGTKEGHLSGQAEVSRFTYSGGSNFAEYAYFQETSVISLSNSAYYYDYSSNPYPEFTELYISSPASMSTGDSFVLYNNGVAFYFDFELDSENSPNDGYHHIQIENSFTSEQAINAVVDYINNNLSNDFVVNYSDFNAIYIESAQRGADENDSYGDSAGFTVTKLSDGYSDPYIVYPELGSFIVYDPYGTSFEFYYDFGSGSGPPYGSASYSIQITGNDGDTLSTLMSKTASAIDDAISMYGAGFSYVNNGSSITITQNEAGDIPDVEVYGSGEVTAEVTTQGTQYVVTQGRYTRFNTPTTSYYVWYNIDGAGYNPNAGGTGIQVNISSAWNGSQIASAVASAINGATAGAVSASANGVNVDITNSAIGPATNADIGNTPYGAVSGFTLTPGSNHTYFSATNHGLTTGTRVAYTASGAAYGGLTSATDYYVIRDTANTFRLATSYANAMAGTSITLTSAGSGSQSVTPYNTSSGGVSITGVTLALSSASAARESLSQVETQMQKIASEIANVGAHQSRLQFSSSGLRAKTEAVQGAYSRIMSIDVASESANLLKTKILQQSATAILAQANQSPALALKLFGG